MFRQFEDITIYNVAVWHYLIYNDIVVQKSKPTSYLRAIYAHNLSQHNISISLSVYDQ